MKIDVSIETLATALAALKIRAIEMQAGKVRADKFTKAHAELEALTYAALRERMAA